MFVLHCLFWTVCLDCLFGLFVLDCLFGLFVLDCLFGLFVWTVCFGSEVIQSAELNIETENAETLENVLQLTMQKCEVVK
jgi:hypothetical protein